MSTEIKVHVVKYKTSANLMMRYLDPETGKQIARSTGTHRQSDAVKVAAKWEAELQEGRYQKQNRMPWDEFCERFEFDGTGGLATSTVDGYVQSLKAFKRLCRPRTIADLTTAKMTAFAREVRKPRTVTIGKGKKERTETVTLSEASVARHLRHLKRVCRWAHRQGYIAKVPAFDMPKKASGARRMKGRPITTEEFERMLEATTKVVGEAAADSWKLLLRGLWVSGLRLSEALSLRWDQHPGAVTLMINGEKSLLAFDADSQKSGKVQLVPLAPEAVQLLEPYQRLQGFVFEPRRQDGLPMARDTHKASRIICKIGKAANVVVDPMKGKCASAHDLRRSFGFRWSRRIMPAELKELMRHSNIETTMTYYVGQNAESTAAGLWAALGKETGKVAPPSGGKKKRRQQKNPANAGANE